SALLPVVFGVVFAGGLVVGIAGFGYALVATSALAAVLDPRDAVVLMIIPLLAANVSLTRELDRSGIRSCVGRFWPYILAAVLGTLVGMAVLRQVPTAVLAFGLGIFTLAYVVLSQPWVPVPGMDDLTAWCVRDRTEVKVGLGLVSGFIFGASNVGVQIVAYLDSLSLDRSTFVGVLAMILVGVSGMRVLAAFALGLYGSSGLVFLSMAAAVPGLLGVGLGRRIRSQIPVGYQTVGVYLLLTIIGLRLASNGAGGL
ncbi:MAG: sulfite exporter TauE/SafE family protein, partial [Halobacteriales archaeon]|nr:sulfite exporter TauE/SafE family protein [Halobacteriales archaeon]